MSSNQALLLNKLKQILTERKQLFQGKVLTLEPLQVIITSNNQLVGCTKLNNVTKNQSVVVFKDLDNKKYYCFSPEVSVTNLNSSVVTYNSFSKRRGKDTVSKKYNIYYFLLDVSNSIEMESVNKCLQILKNEIEHSLKIKRDDLVGIITFADNVYEYTKYINKPSEKSKVIDILNNVKNAYDSLENKYDRYTPATFTYADFNIAEDDVDKVAKLDAYSKFWVDEGTDLPENGIDAIISVLNSLSADRVDKYLYVITDNNKYSRNESDISLILNAKFNKLYFDIIEPINSPSEQIVNEGEESNPYCSNSVATRVKVNEEIKGDYLPNSNILIKTNDTFIWEGGGEGKYHIISDYITGYPTEESYAVFPKRNTNFNITGRYRVNLGDWVEINVLINEPKPLFRIKVLYFGSMSYENSGNSWTIIRTGTSSVLMRIYACFGEYDRFFSDFFEELNVILAPIISIAQNDRLDIIIDDINTTQWEVVIEDDYNLSYYDMTESHIVPVIPDTSGTNLEDYIYKRLTQNLVTTSTIRRLFITEPPEEKGFENYEHIFVIQQEDVVKSLCLPQQIPLELPPSNLYQSTLISDKIFFQ